MSRRARARADARQAKWYAPGADRDEPDDDDEGDEFDHHHAWDMAPRDGAPHNTSTTGEQR